ncbi:MAG: hypothetical protein IJ083_16565 [Clostridia bacterium]|nr:hypothetical protein [Clostridia bacterium]
MIQRLERFGHMFLRSVLREVLLFAAIFLGYLIQVCVLPNFPFLSLQPFMLFTVMATVTVCYGRLRAFWCGAIYGILMEIMLSTYQLMNLLFYPAVAMLCSVLFADKSAQQLEYEKNIGKSGRDRSPYLRTFLCAQVYSVFYEVVNLAYLYLRESLFPLNLVLRGLWAILLCSIFALIVMLPLRMFFGYPIRRRVVPKVVPYQPSSTQEPMQWSI